jgi:small subunit ribosomal protein S2
MEFNKNKFLDKKNIPYNKKTFLIKQFLNYKSLIGNKLRFTNSESYEYIFRINFIGNTIFNVNKSLFLLKRALLFIKQIKENKGTILFISTRKDLKNVIAEIGKKTELPYVNYRWSKGLLTNWENTNASIRFYNLFIKRLEMRNKKRLKMKNTFIGLSSMTRLPDAVFIFDLSMDFEAFKEAKSLNIPVISLVDTNIVNRDIDYPILANTESVLSVIFFANLIIASFKKLSK